jgi:hypothetical protein
MNRAERRRQEKAQKRKTATYNLTKEQLDKMIEAELKDKIQEIKQEATSDAVNTAMVLMLSLPMVVLMEDYWQKSFSQRIPKFIDRVFGLYEDWQDGKVELDDLRDKLWEIGGIRFEESERDDT